MACITLSKGRKLKCKGGNGGIKAVSFVPFDSAALINVIAGEVATLPGTITAAYRYELKNTGNSYSEEITADSDARTVLYTGTLSLVLQKLDLDTRNEIKMLAMGEVLTFIEDNNGNVLLMGAGAGAEVTGGSILTGGARGEMSGANLTLTSIENDPIAFLSTAAKATYAGIVVEGVE